jgi:hypothetical protein
VAPFAIELLKGKGSAKQVVYLEYIVFDNEPVDQRFLLPANATTANATNPNDTVVEGNNTQALSGDNVEGNNNNTITTADASGAENNNNNNNNNNKTGA